MQVRNFFQQITAVFYRIDAFELILERFGARSINGLLIHAAGIVIADFLNFGGDFWIDMCIRGLFHNRVKRVVVLLRYLIETAPARILRRYFRSLDPTAIGVHEKIILRFHGRIHVLRIERPWVLVDLGWRVRAQARCAKETCDEERS